MRKWSLLALILALLVTVAAPATAGSLLNPPSNGIPGQWVAGSTPQNLDPDKPVILFVHGLNSSGKTWFEKSDMYETAYNAGYQTVFIDLYDAAGTPKSMWDNGRLLAGKIAEIGNHYNKKLVIVAHSKGGVDSQTALVHYGASPYVSNVITLGSPHHGSQLADLAYSSWAGWLAELLGSKNDGTYSMQTSYMGYFRSITDNHANARNNPIYTFAGTEWLNFFSGIYLSVYGTNDGVVTVKNAHAPNGKMIRTGPWNHTTIKNGSSTFSLFQSYLVSEALKINESVQIASAERSDPESNGDLLIRGGEYAGMAESKLTVESGAERVTIDWISDKPADQFMMTAPDNSVITVPAEAVRDDYVLRNAWHHKIVLDRPQAGQWTLQAMHQGEGAYVMSARFDSAVSSSVTLRKNKAGDRFELETARGKVKDVKAEYSLNFIPERDNRGKTKSVKVKQKEKLDSRNGILIPAGEQGVYNITVELQGTTQDGAPFERTFIRTVYRDKNGKLF